jgi:phosphomethylpyrimidine synthase
LRNIAQELREYAAQQNLSEVVALESGMKEKAEEFKQAGAEISTKA